jgi:hypothetical protein
MLAVATVRKPISLLHATQLNDSKRQPLLGTILIEHNLD